MAQAPTNHRKVCHPGTIVLSTVLQKLQQMVTQMTDLNIGLIGMKTDILNAIDKADPQGNASGNARSQSPPVISAPNSTDTDAISGIEQKQILLAMGGTVSEKTAKSALNGEFVNLSDFIPCIPESVTDMETIVSHNGTLHVRPRRQRKVIDSFSTWISAWANYEALVLTKLPNLYHNFAKYRYFIQTCDRKYLWHACYAYDCRFRASVANSKIWDFHQSNSDIYITTFDATTVKRSAKQCYRCKAFDHNVMECPFPAPNQMAEIKKTSSSASSSARFSRDKWSHLGKEGCHNFQSGRCTDTYCRRAHVCKACRGPESFFRCPCNQG